MAGLFSMKHSPVDVLDRKTLIEQWMNWLLTHFHWSDYLVNQCNAEWLEFMEMLSSVCGHQGNVQSLGFLWQ
jgi:hypothetical protein